MKLLNKGIERIYEEFSREKLNLGVYEKNNPSVNLCMQMNIKNNLFNVVTIE